MVERTAEAKGQDFLRIGAITRERGQVFGCLQVAEESHHIAEIQNDSLVFLHGVTFQEGLAREGA